MDFDLSVNCILTYILMDLVNLGLTRNVTISLPIVGNMFRILTDIDIVLIYVETEMFPRVRHPGSRRVGRLLTKSR